MSPKTGYWLNYVTLLLQEVLGIMNQYFSSFCWNSFMILAIWLACVFDARGIDPNSTIDDEDRGRSLVLRKANLKGQLGRNRVVPFPINGPATDKTGKDRGWFLSFNPLSFRYCFYNPSSELILIFTSNRSELSGPTPWI